MRQTKIRRFTVDKLASVKESVENRLFAQTRAKKLKHKDFTIISNNCWGGHVYRRYGLPYNSPTVGLYFFAEEYLKFVEDLENSIRSPIKMIHASESKYAAVLEKKGQMHIPVGVINDRIEVVFLHYKTPQEALEKWTRRCKRVNFDHLIVKFSEMNLCQESHVIRFEQLPYEKKLLLLAHPHPDVSSGIVVDRYTEGNEISNDTLYYDKWVDLTELINS